MVTGLGWIPSMGYETFLEARSDFSVRLEICFLLKLFLKNLINFLCFWIILLC
jgi:hypothetical protein